MSREMHEAWREVLFWAKRLSYHSADRYPHWRENYLKAEQRLKELKDKEHETP